MFCAKRKFVSTSYFMLLILMTSFPEMVKSSVMIFQRVPGSRYTSELGSLQTSFEDQCLYACRNTSACSTVSYSKKYQKCLLGTTWINMDYIIEEPEYEVFYRKDLPQCTSSKCFEYVDEGKTWDKANIFCGSQHQEGHLAHVKTEKDADLIRSLIHVEVEAWLGATDVASEGVFYWTDNSLLSDGFTFWQKDQPDNSGDEDCVSIRANTEYKWNDLECYKNRWFVCQYPFKSIDDLVFSTS